MKYAQEKIATVRRLHRTSLPIPHAGGVYPAKAPINILGGLLTFESTWPTCFGQSIREALRHDEKLGRINLGCVAAHGHFVYEQPRLSQQPSGSEQPRGNEQPSGEYVFTSGGKPATDFLFRLISELQFSGTVPMIDVMAYANSLSV